MASRWPLSAPMACGTEVVAQMRDVHPQPVLTPPTLSGGPGVGLQLGRLMEQHTHTGYPVVAGSRLVKLMSVRR